MLDFECVGCHEKAPVAACGPPHGGIPALELPSDVPGHFILVRHGQSRGWCGRVQTIPSTTPSPGVQQIEAGMEDHGLHVRDVSAQHCDWTRRCAWRHHADVRLPGAVSQTFQAGARYNMVIVQICESGSRRGEWKAVSSSFAVTTYHRGFGYRHSDPPKPF